jgi:DNA modification methylase
MTAPHLPSTIEHIATDALIPYARNSRTHSPEQVAQLARSIEQFGFTNPVLVDEHNTLIAGHGRVMAAQRIGLPAVPAIRLLHLNDAQRRAYVIADNQLALQAGWDMATLAREVEDLMAESFDVSLLGFGDDELAALLAEHSAEDETGVGGATDDEAVPMMPVRPVTALGDTWLLGKHRVMCGDSTCLNAVGQMMCGAKADMVFTDPPYGVEYQSNMRTKSARFDVLANDDQFLHIEPIIQRYSVGWVFVWTSWKVQTKWVETMSGLGYPTNIVIWHKPGGGIGDLKKTFASDYEVALVWHRGAELCGKRIGSVWTINKDGASTYMHPTQKPTALAEEALDKTTKPGAVVLDLFGGSGSTLIACEKTGRINRSMELDPRYVDVIVKRWQEFTGKAATLEGDGRTFEQIAAERATAVEA